VAYVRQRGEIWYVGFRGATGRWIEKASKAQSKTEARRLAADLERQAERQRLGLEALPTDSTQTLAELCSWWITNRCPEATREKQRLSLTAHVIDANLGSLPLRAVTPAVLEGKFADMEKEGYKPGTINKLRSTLHAIFVRAKKSGLWNGANPASDTEPRRVSRVVRDTLSAEEVELLLPRVSQDWRGFFAVAAYLGLRKGECAGLRKTDVDLRLGTLTVRGSYERDTTKGGHADVLPIPPPLLPYVWAGLQTEGPFLFPMPDGSMRPENSSPQRILQHALGRAGLVGGYDHICRRCKALGLEKPHVERHADCVPRECPVHKVRLWPRAIPRKLRFHDLRHSCATVLLRAGVDIHRVQRILRHADVRTTTGTYAHLGIEDLRQGLEQTFGTPEELLAVKEVRAVSGILPAGASNRNEQTESGAGNPPTSQAVSRWAEQGSNLRQAPCKGAALPLSYPPGWTPARRPELPVVDAFLRHGGRSYRS